MTVYISADAKNLREELASLRNQGGYQEQQFYFDGLVTNGTFDADTDWTKETGWTISGGVASVDASVSGAGVITRLQQNISTVVGETYVISADFSNVTNFTGNELILQAPTGDNTIVAADGSFSVTFVATSTSSTITVRTSGAVNGDESADVDNISVFEVDANDDVIHTMPKGWKPKDVFEDGLLQREGAAHDYEVVYDGFDYVVKPTVAPSATTQTCVIGVKA